ncbi:MAG: flgK [Devosia sp.]|nr:flgK [Devosia sp.]
MGLGVALGNALSGMGSNQKALDILSRNVSNAGTPGYHRQSMNVVDFSNGTGSSTYARGSEATRAFNATLQSHYTRQVADSSYANTMSTYLDRLQGFLGKPGDTGSLDTQFSSFENSLQALSTSPDDFSVRSQVMSNAQGIAETLNRLSGAVQGLRGETEGQIASRVSDLNNMLGSLETINGQLGDVQVSETGRSALLDQRDRVVSGIAEVLDVQASYRPDGSVALMTRAGVSLIDVKASTFKFEPAGSITAASQFSLNSAESKVGKLTLVTPSGMSLDLVQQGVLRSGELAGLVKLRDDTLVAAQNQLDQIAAGLSQALSTVQTAGTPATVGAATGFEVNLATMQAGNDFVVNYTQGGTAKSVRVVRVDDATKLPMDYADANGTRVVGVNFSGGPAAAAAAIQTALGAGLTVSNPAGSTIRIVDDGAAGTTDVKSMTARTTVTGTQGSGLALSLFVDGNNQAFTNSLDGTPQMVGFAGRIQLNSALLADNKLLVQSSAGGTLGDASRPNLLLQQLGSMKFAGSQTADGQPGTFRLNGNVTQLISQSLNYQGSVVANSLNAADTQQLTLDAISLQMDDEYGVDVDEEMSRLMELQNAYAANARVISIVQELLDALMSI